MEGANVDKAYLYGKLDTPIIMDQSNISSGNFENPGYICELIMSIYGLKPAGMLCGSLLDKKFAFNELLTRLKWTGVYTSTTIGNNLSCFLSS